MSLPDNYDRTFEGNYGGQKPAWSFFNFHSQVWNTEKKKPEAQKKERTAKTKLSYTVQKHVQKQKETGILYRGSQNFTMTELYFLNYVNIKLPREAHGYFIIIVMICNTPALCRTQCTVNVIARQQTTLSKKKSVKLN
jgi:hypothetical protein